MSDHRDHPTPFDTARFRQVLGHFPTGVVVVTAVDEGTPVGLAIGSFASVSLDPPLVGFFPNKASASWPRMQRAGSFAVNVLGQHQEDVCRTFAAKATDKFAAIGWKPGRSGAPILDDVVASIECDVGDVFDAGDHYFVIGKVVAMEVLKEGAPLVFFRGGYTSLA